MVLVEGIVDGRNLPLAEEVIERGVELEKIHAEVGGGIAVDHEGGLQAEVLLVGAYVDDLGYSTQGLANARLPGAQLGEVVPAQRVLVLGVCAAAADPHVLRGLEEKGGARLVRELPAQPGDDQVGGDFSLGDWLQHDEKERTVALAAPSKGNHVVDGRISPYNGDKVRQFLLHRLERYALVGDEIPHDTAGVLLGHETLGDDDIEVDVERHGAEQGGDHHAPVCQRPLERPIVSLQQSREPPFNEKGQTSWLSLALRPQHAGTHHRRGRQRDHQRDQDRGGQRDREFAEEAADDSAHEQDGHEDGHQRDAHRDNGEADLPRSQQRGFKRGNASLDMPGHVFEDHHRVVHDETGGDGEGHERKVVQAVSGEIHDAKGADERDGHRDGGNERRLPPAEKKEDHQDHEADGDQKGALHLAQGGADGGRGVGGDLQVNRIGDRGPQHGQDRFHPIDGLDHVGARLPPHLDQHGRPSIRQPRVAQILHGIRNGGDIGQTHRGAIAVGDDERQVVRRFFRLVVGGDLPVPGVPVE